jgi:hypothetical protein
MTPDRVNLGRFSYPLFANALDALGLQSRAAEMRAMVTQRLPLGIVIGTAASSLASQPDTPHSEVRSHASADDPMNCSAGLGLSADPSDPILPAFADGDVLAIDPLEHDASDSGGLVFLCWDEDSFTVELDAADSSDLYLRGVLELLADNPLLASALRVQLSQRADGSKGQPHTHNMRGSRTVVFTYSHCSGGFSSLFSCGAQPIHRRVCAAAPAHSSASTPTAAPVRRSCRHPSVLRVLCLVFNNAIQLPLHAS